MILKRGHVCEEAKTYSAALSDLTGTLDLSAYQLRESLQRAGRDMHDKDSEFEIVDQINQDALRRIVG